MPATRPTQRTQLSLSTRSIGLLVLTVAAVTALIAMTRASVRVLGWMAAAGAMAALLDPLVQLLGRWMRRGVAVLITFLLVFGTVGGIAYMTVNDVVREARVLQRVAPERAQALEKSKRFGSAARAFDLEKRARRAVKDIPERLRGGSSADAIRSAGTRGVAYLATTVMTIFLILNGHRLVSAGLGQVPDEKLRYRLRNALHIGVRRGVQYTTGSLGMSAIAGIGVYLVARIFDVPGPAPLALWAALWDVVPVVGGVIGVFPVAALAAATDPATGVAIFVGGLAYEFVEVRFLQRRLENSSIHVGSFLTLFVGAAGLELYGLGGALLSFFALCVGMGFFETWRAK